ncbi:MAG: YihY family inner membrane protein [Pseudomonadota bacterium]|nr:YihY family inner membrane protein [Pseudomonadota bacterium]
MDTHLKDHESVGVVLQTLRTWPWFNTVRTLRRRFREDRLGLTASSLTFTTLIALVPLVTVMLAVFTAFPMFSGFEGALEDYFLRNLVPDSIARPVLQSLRQFATNARGMGTVGLVLLVVTALALVLTIDRTLNGIWRVQKARPIAQRILVYWAALTLGPLALGVSLSLTSYAVSVSRGFVTALPSVVTAALDVAQFGLLAGFAGGMYRYVPNAPVRWRHALAGGLFVAVGFEIARRVLAWYVDSMPSYSAIYGAFATLPILLLWIYVSWVIVLLGAVIAAYAPSLQMRVASRPQTPGWRFDLSLAVLRRLQVARTDEARGLTPTELARELRADPLQLEPVLATLVEIDWVSRLDEGDDSRFVMLCDPERETIAPLAQRTLLTPGVASAAFRQLAGFEGLHLAQVLAQLR